MKRVAVFFILLCQLCISRFNCLYAADSAETTNNGSKIVGSHSGSNPVIDRQVPESSQYMKSDRAYKDDLEVDTYFSGYPKSFIIPKGVCDTKEPSMVISR